jgi:hypothetical protein
MVFSQVLRRFIRVPYNLALFHDYIVLLTRITWQGLYEDFSECPGLHGGPVVPLSVPACLPAREGRAALR